LSQRQLRRPTQKPALKPGATVGSTILPRQLRVPALSPALRPLLIGKRQARPPIRPPAQRVRRPLPDPAWASRIYRVTSATIGRRTSSPAPLRFRINRPRDQSITSPLVPCMARMPCIRRQWPIKSAISLPAGGQQSRDLYGSVAGCPEPASATGVRSNAGNRKCQSASVGTTHRHLGLLGGSRTYYPERPDVHVAGTRLRRTGTVFRSAADLHFGS
jgi:hypothetical protein